MSASLKGRFCLGPHGYWRTCVAHLSTYHSFLYRSNLVWRCAISQLSFSSIPGFVDIADSAIAGDVALTDDSLTKVSHNAKYAAVRCEIIFMGYYGNGDTIPTPTSPVDGYAYSRSECMFGWEIYSNRARQAPYAPGQQYPPPQSNSQSQNNLYNFPGEWNIVDLTGVVSLRTSYYSGGGAEVVTNDGIIKVFCYAQRSSVSIAD